MPRLQNSGLLTAVITGASAGLGRATSIAFAQRGCNVGLIARDAERLRNASDEIERAGGRGLALPADVADAQAVEAAADRAAAEFGGIDVWVNCAMAGLFSPLSEMTAAEFHRVTEVTYLGYVHGTMAALKHMRPRNRGTIVQVGSALAYRAIPLQSAYCGAKFAIRGFTDALRSELIHERSSIRVSMVQMPALNTPQFDWARNKMPRRAKPLGTIFQPEVGAQAIVHAALAAPRELWVGRSTLEAIVGAIAIPGFLDRYLARKAYRGQMSRETADASDPDNLFAAVPGQFGAHGRFDAKAVDEGAVMIDPAILVMALGGGAVGIVLGGVLAALHRSRSISLLR
jgi:short-subunit dehydrogenase